MRDTSLLFPCAQGALMREEVTAPLTRCSHSSKWQEAVFALFQLPGVFVRAADPDLILFYAMNTDMSQLSREATTDPHDLSARFQLALKWLCGYKRGISANCCKSLGTNVSSERL